MDEEGAEEEEEERGPQEINKDLFSRFSFVRGEGPLVSGEL